MCLVFSPQLNSCDPCAVVSALAVRAGRLFCFKSFRPKANLDFFTDLVLFVLLFSYFCFVPVCDCVGVFAERLLRWYFCLGSCRASIINRYERRCIILYLFIFCDVEELKSTKNLLKSK